MSARRALLLLGLAALATAGCKRRAFYEWRDEPYIRPVYRGGERAALRRMKSRWPDDREIGCRALAVMAREARAKGQEEKARRYARTLMDHYATETSADTRSVLLALCLREAGRGDKVVGAFLASKVNSGEHPASAAYALAALKPPGAFESISAAFERAADFETRYELLGALWLLGDRRAVPIYEKTLAEIDSAWPARVHHMKKGDYKKALAGRLETLRAACGPRQ